MKKQEIKYIDAVGNKKSCIISFELTTEGGKALVDGQGFDEAYEWSDETDENEGISDLRDFVIENLIHSDCSII